MYFRKKVLKDTKNILYDIFFVHKQNFIFSNVKTVKFPGFFVPEISGLFSQNLNSQIHATLIYLTRK